MRLLSHCFGRCLLLFSVFVFCGTCLGPICFFFRAASLDQAFLSCVVVCMLCVVFAVLFVLFFGFCLGWSGVVLIWFVLFCCVVCCLFVRSFACSLARSFICLFVRLFVVSLVCWFVCWLVGLFVCLFVGWMFGPAL